MSDDNGRVIASCNVDANLFKPWEEGLPEFSLDEMRGDLTVKDERWFWNCISTDAVARSCGRLGRASGEREHQHLVAEVALCREVSMRCSEILRRCKVPQGDEAMGGHPWFPFAAPSIIGDPAPSTLSIDVLEASCGFTLYPGLFDTALDLRTGLPTYADFEFQYEHDAYQQLFTYLELHPHLRQPKYFRPVGLRTPDNGIPVFPHFLVAMTESGSLAGVAGLTVWT